MRIPTHAARVIPHLLILCVFLALTALPAAAAGNGRVLILKSQDSPPYTLALQGIEEALETYAGPLEIEVVALEGKRSQGRKPLQAAQTNGTELVLALGAPAFDAATVWGGKVPVIAGLVLDTVLLEGLPSATGVCLTFSVDVQIEWIRRLLPEAKTVGVLYNPAENGSRVAEAEKKFEAAGLVLVASAVTKPDGLLPALERIGDRIDLLWGIPDNIVYNTRSSRSLILYSFRNKLPLVGISNPWVESGALYALERDYVDIGRQCGEMAILVLSGNAPESIPPVRPRKVLYHLNMKTAKHMNLAISDDLVNKADKVY